MQYEILEQGMFFTIVGLLDVAYARLDFKSKVNYVVIEGSDESSRPGEFVMDVTEYVQSSESGREDINYFQLKHSEKRVNTPFQLSELQNTLEGSMPEDFLSSSFLEYDE